jgi:hypothetical protein
VGLLPQNTEHTQHMNPAYTLQVHPVCTYSRQVNLKVILVEIRAVLCAVLSCVSGVALLVGLLVSLNLLLVEPTKSLKSRTKRNVCYSSAMTWVEACYEK